MDIREYKVIIFDCDGVIYDTNRLKLEAFTSSLADFSEDYVQEFVKYLSANFGRSRYVHIRYFIEQILKIPFDPKLYDHLILNYGSRCKSLYNQAQLCAGVIDLLDDLKNFTKYIASGSDQNELRNAFKANFLDYHFKAIYGSPRGKNDLVQDICSLYNRNEVLMIGDSHADYWAAKCAEIEFLYVSRYSADKVNMKALTVKENLKSVMDLSSIIR